MQITEIFFVAVPIFVSPKVTKLYQKMINIREEAETFAGNQSNLRLEIEFVIEELLAEIF